MQETGQDAELFAQLSKLMEASSAGLSLATRAQPTCWELQRPVRRGGSKDHSKPAICGVGVRVTFSRPFGSFT